MFRVRNLIFKIWRAFSAVVERLVGKSSLGVRVLAFRGNEVLLVKMTYLRDWYLPGGGVDRGESLREAALRELREETGFDATDLRLRGVYFNDLKGRSDHVALFVANDLRAIAGCKPDREISEIGFFAIDALPTGVSPATRARIEEFARGAEPTDRW